MRTAVGHTLPGKASRSCKIHVCSSRALVFASSVALLMMEVASRRRMRELSTSMWEFGQSHTGVFLRSSANSSGYRQTRCMG